MALTCALFLLHHAASLRILRHWIRVTKGHFGDMIDFLFRLDNRCPLFVCGAYIWRIMAGKFISVHESSPWQSFSLQLRASHLRLFSSFSLQLNIGLSQYLGSLLRSTRPVRNPHEGIWQRSGRCLTPNSPILCSRMVSWRHRRRVYSSSSINIVSLSLSLA